MLAMARGRVVIESRWRICAAERSIVAHIGPQPARAGLGLGEHRHGGVVDMQTLGGEHMSA